MTSLTLGLMAAVCWGLHDITIRYLSRSAPMMGSLLCVLFIGSLFQAGMLMVMGPHAISGSAALLSVCAGIAFLLANVGLYFSLARGPVRLVSPIIASLSVVSVGIAVVEGVSISMAQILAVAALMVGIAIVAMSTPEEDQEFPPIGVTIAFALLAAFGFAFSFKFGQMAAQISGDLETTLLARITAFAVLAVVLLVKSVQIWPGKAALLPLLGMGLFDSIAIYSINLAAPKPNPEYAAVASSTFGLLTIILAWALLKEKMSRAQWLGCLISFSAVGYLAL